MKWIKLFLIIALTLGAPVQVTFAGGSAGGGSGGLSEYVDDADWTDSTSSHGLIGGIYQSTPQTITDGDTGPIQVDDNGRVVITTGDEDVAHVSGDPGVLVFGVRQSTQADFGADGDNIPFSINDNGELRVTGASGTQFTEDSVHSSGDNLSMAGVVRNDTLAALCTTDGDNCVLQVDANGAVYVNVAAGGGFADDADFTAGTTAGTPAQGVYESTPTSVTDGDLGIVGISSTRRLLVDISDGAGAVNVICDSGCAGGTQHAEDDVAANLDVGTLALYLRDDTPTASTAANNDYEPAHLDGFGSQYVTLTDAAGAAVDASTINPTTATTWGLHAEDTASSNGQTGSPLLSVRRDTLTAGNFATADADFTWTGTDNYGALWVTQTDNLGNVLAQIEDVAHVTADPGIMLLGVENEDQATLAAGDKDYTPIATTLQGNVLVELIGGTTAVTATNLDVQIGGSDTLTVAAHAVTNAGTFATQATLDAETTKVIGTVNLSATDNAVLDTIDAQLDKIVTDPCTALAPNYIKIDIVDTTTTEIINESASNFVHICSMVLVTNAANNVAIVEDATDACADPDAGVVGGVTAAEGFVLAANGGLTLGNGRGTVLKTASTAMNVCIIASASTQLTGGVTYVYSP